MQIRTVDLVGNLLDIDVPVTPHIGEIVVIGNSFHRIKDIAYDEIRIACLTEEVESSCGLASLLYAFSLEEEDVLKYRRK